MCEAPLTGSLSSEVRLLEFGDAGSETVQFEAGSIDARMLPEPTASMSGGVLVKRGDKLAGAETADYDPRTLTLHLDGDVRYEDPDTEIVSQSADFAYDTGQITFTGAEFLLGDNNSRGAADLLQISQEGTLNLGGVHYTTCPPGSNDWLIAAGNIELDTAEGVGTARNVKLRFQGVPIIYLPYLTFPINNARKSGVLTPTIGSAGRSGNEIALPYYWNIRENYDATISPRWLSNRGLQIGTEFRYLTERNDGQVTFEYLADDSLIDSSRHLIAVDHRTLFNSGWRNTVDFREVSDAQYFEDLGGTLSLTSITHLNRNLRFDYHGRHWSLFGQVQDFQTLDETILAEDQPYQRLPQMKVVGYYPDLVGALGLAFDGELVNFDRDTGVTGWRLNAAPSVELAFERPGWFVKPAAAVDYTRYDLKNTLPGEATEFTRTVPIASFDTGMIFERTFNRSSSLIQTIEPRLLYVNVPFRDQDGLPVFDTIMPDLNLVQLYRKNRFLGADRIGDTEQYSVGITSRIIDVDSGEEKVTATIGQTRYLSDQLVTLPGETLVPQTSSDYIAEIRFLLFQHINFDVGHQWSNGENGTTQSEARLQYRPQNNKILNLAYRFRRDSLEQGDVSWSWPLGQSWNFVGRYNYSFRDKESLEQFFGLEYESCCWGFRVVQRRFLSTRDGTRDTSFGLQLVLKGMTSLGTTADKMLERGILGYSPDLK
jgi:LPS-assembly protein